MYKIFDIDLEDRLSVKAYGPANMSLKSGDACIVKMDGWLDYGHTVEVSECEDDEARPSRKMPSVLRRATYQDQCADGENKLFSRTAQKKCQECVDKLKLDMRLLKVRFSFDRSRLFVLYSADESIDLKELLGKLAGEVHAKIEMRQLGVRDAAQLVGGMSSCGRKLCCKQWLQGFENVYIKMAKNQGLSLNPASINGMCGRLKCCLRFEDNCYKDLAGRMPREGAKVETPIGSGMVVARNILRQKLKVSMDDRRVLEFEADQVKVVKSDGKRKTGDRGSAENKS